MKLDPRFGYQGTQPLAFQLTYSFGCPDGALIRDRKEWYTSTWIFRFVNLIRPMSPHGTPSAPKTAPSLNLGDTAVFWLLGSILVFAPLLRPSQSALALSVLELLSVFLLAIILWRPRRNLITRPEAIVLILLFVLPLLYLIPLPAGLVERLPGREPYLTGRALLAGEEEAGGFAPLSLYPLETESALLLLLLPIAVFIGTRTLDASRTLRFVPLLLALAALQSLLGLLQYGASEGSPLLLGMQLPEIQSAKGTYTNRNHFAGWLAMLLPVALALMLYSVGRDHTSAGRGWRQRMVFFASMRGHAAFVYGVIALLLLVGIVFTRSRTGLALSILALLLSMPVFAQRIGGNNVYGSVGTIIAVAVGIGIAVGLVPVLDRFSVAGTIQDDRWTIFSATLNGIGAFLPIGSGPGSYSDVFPIFQPLELGRWFINHAHNDYLEWLFEGGLLSAALILLLLVLYARQWTRVWTRNRWSRFRFVQVAAGIGILLLLLYGLSDFNLHNPANIAYFAFLAGVFFSPPGKEVRPKRGRARRPKGTRSASSTAAKEQLATPVRKQAAPSRPKQEGRTSRLKEIRSGFSASARKQPSARARNQAESVRPKKRRTPRLKETPSTFSAPAGEQPSAPVRSDEQSTGTGLDDRDDRKQARNADESVGDRDLAVGLNRTRETIVKLAHRMPRLLLVQVGETFDKETLASEIRALGRRLTVYIQAVEQQLEQISNDRPMPVRDLDRSPVDPGPTGEGKLGGNVSRRGDLEALQEDLDSVLAAVDAFVDHPDRDDGLSDFGAKLRDAEQRCRAIADESAEASQGTQSQQRDTAGHEPITAQKPEPGGAEDEALAEETKAGQATRPNL